MLILSRLQLDTFAQLAKLKVFWIHERLRINLILPQSLSITVNALAAAADVLIAATLCTLLHLSRTGFQRLGPSIIL